MKATPISPPQEPDGLERAGERKNVNGTAKSAGIDDLENDCSHHGIECECQTDGHDSL
jgi:hypothetical protein